MNRPWLTRPLAAALAAVVVLLPTAAQAAAVSPELMPRFPDKPTEVVIVGTRHSGQLEFPGSSPARFRALLNEIDPAAVGIETSPSWFKDGVYYEITYEAHGVALPWTKEKGKELRPIDWQPEGLDMMGALSWPSAGEPSEEDEQLAELDTTDLFFADTPAWTKGYMQGFEEWSSSPASEAMRRYMLYRDLQIARQIVNMAADYSGQRVAVLIGAAHKPDLDRFLANVPNITIRHATEWKDGLTPEKVAAEERRPDHLAILWYNLASGRVPAKAVDIWRMNALLNPLEKESPADPELFFLRARWYQVWGYPSGALPIYQHLAWSANLGDRSFTFPDRELAKRVHAYWNEHDPFGNEKELPLGTVLSPVANLSIRQRVLYELAQQQTDASLREKARTELLQEPLNPTQLKQLQELLEPQNQPAK